MDVFARDELYRLTDRTSFPGVDADETRAIREWIRREGAKYEQLRFNVRIGAGKTLDDTFDERFKKYWFRVTQMRCDLVAWNPPNAITIVEGKVLWANDAVWQLLSYRDAYVSDFPDSNVALVGVCEAYTPSGRELAASQGIRLHVYTFRDPLPQASATSAESS